MQRAFRRPVENDVVDAWLDTLWRGSRSEYATLEESLVESFVATLCSPRFLYLVELPIAQGESAEEPRPNQAGPPSEGIDDWALASRLSYFLQGGPPSDELLKLASAGELRSRRGEAAAQLLDDPRSRRFVEHFTEEWLRLDRHDGMTPDADTFPELSRFVKRDMRIETTRFVEHALHSGAPLGDLIDADYTLLNENLAAYYGVADVKGPSFRVVPLPREQERGGLLSQGSFLVGHSDGLSPHPIKRGVWLRARILGDPPPPPPPNVPELDPTAPGFEGLSLTEQLQLHRDKDSCRACHAGIDPWGVAFERLGAGGRLEPIRGGAPVEASTTLPKGTAIDGIRDLKEYLIQNEEERFARALATHLLGYGLGRDVGFADDAAIDRIVEGARSGGLGLRSIVLAIVESEAFVR